MKRNEGKTMEIIGLTGGTGSGKSAVSMFLRKKGLYVIDADQISHEIIKKNQPAYEEIVEEFGTEILDSDGEIIRQRLGQIVFSDPKKLSFLNRCTHKYIRMEIEETISQQKKAEASMIIIDAPLLAEAGLIEICDEVWVVCADRQVRLERTMTRDGLTYSQAEKRIFAQKSDEEYRAMANRIILNNGGLEELGAELDQLWNNKEGK